MNNHDERDLAVETTPKPEVPSPEEVSMLARTKDPSLTSETTKTVTDAGTAAKTRAGVSWVRPTDLLAAKSAAWAGRGIDFQAGLAERVRAGVGRGTKTTRRAATRSDQAGSARAKQLPPLSAFGRRTGSRSMTPVTRAGISRGNR